MRKLFRGLAACMLVLALVAVLGIGFALAEGATPDDVAAAVLAVVEKPNSWLAWAGLVTLAASLICSVTPTPARDSKWYWPYRILAELPALNIGRAKQALTFIAPLGLVLGLSACGLTAGSAATGASLAASAYTLTKDVNDGLVATQSIVCGAWGGFYADVQAGRARVPEALTQEAEDVSALCSAPPIANTPIATLLRLWRTVQKLNAAQGAPPA